MYAYAQAVVSSEELKAACVNIYRRHLLAGLLWPVRTGKGGSMNEESTVTQPLILLL